MARERRLTALDGAFPRRAFCVTEGAEMDPKDASDVARRCLCFELLWQRLGLEIDEDDTAADRDEVRKKWISRIEDLGLGDVLLTEERALLERPVGSLSEDDLDDVQGRATAALFLLWALGRVSARPSVESFHDAADIIAERGLLGDGSISGANRAVASAALRPAEELREALAAYGAKQPPPGADGTAEEVVAALGTHALAWVVDRAMKYDGGGHTIEV